MDDETVKLIEAIRSFPCLWQVSSQIYKDARAKENAWKEVASQMGESEEDCLRKWKNLRDRFVRELKKVKEKKSGDSGSAYKSSWPLYDVLLFLQDTVRHRVTYTNFPAPASRDPWPVPRECAEILEDTVQNTSTPQQPPSKKMKDSKDDEIEVMILRSLKDMQERRVQRNMEDEEDLFGRQIAATLRRLSNRQKASAKHLIQKVLIDVEFPEDPDSPTH